MLIQVHFDKKKNNVSTSFTPSATSTVDMTVDSVFLQVFPLLGPEVAEAELLRAFNPDFDFLTSEECGPAGFVVRDAVEVELATHEFYLRVTGGHPTEFIDVDLILFWANSAVRDGLSF